MFHSMRLFLSISLFAFLLSSCSHYKLQGAIVKEDKTYTVPYFTELGGEHIFNARIEAFGNDIGGMCVVKTLGNNHQRVALLSDFGNTLMDFEFKNQEILVHYVMEDLNKKIIINQLKKYFQLLLNSEYLVSKSVEVEGGSIYQSKLKGKRVFLELDTDSQLIRLRQASAAKTKAQIDYSVEGGKLSAMHFKSFGLPIEMKFKKID